MTVAPGSVSTVIWVRVPALSTKLVGITGFAGAVRSSDTVSDKVRFLLPEAPAP